MEKKHSILLALPLAAAIASCLSTATAGENLRMPRVNTANLEQDGRYDELVVKYKDGSPQRSSATARMKALGNAARAALPGSTPRIADKRRLAVGADVVSLSRKLGRAEATALMRQIAADPNVEYVEPVIRMQALAVPTDPRWSEQWGLKTPAQSGGGINLPLALDRSQGTGVVVAVLDTGVARHPDLAANVLYDDGYDFVYDAETSGRETNGRIPGGYDPGDWIEAGQCGEEELVPSSWHGTHVAGTIAAVTDNDVGVAGVAPEAAILPVRVLGHCGGSSTDIADAIVWAAGGKAVPGVPAHGHAVEVINMSLGSNGAVVCPNVYKEALAHAHSRGVVVVVAAGNSDTDVTRDKGVGKTMGNCSDDLVVVGGVGPNGRRGGLTRDGRGREGKGSSWGQRVDLAAPMGTGWLNDDDDPGVDQVLSTVNLGEREPGEPGYAFYYGTSMASPHVAGAVALMQAAADTTLTPSQVKQMLMGTVRGFPFVPDKTIGRGILDANAAVLAAAEGPCAADDRACTRAPIRLDNKVPYELRAGAAGSETLYAIDVPAGVGGPLSILTSGGQGDANLLVSFGEAPTMEAAQYKSVRSGNNDVVRIARPQAGVYYIKLVGNRAYSGVRIEARHD